MKARIEMDTRPFEVPNYAQVSHSEHVVNVPLATLEPSVLEALCDEFRASVFRCAKKEQPPSVAASMTESEIQAIFKQAVNEVIQIIKVDAQAQPTTFTEVDKFADNLIRALRIRYNLPSKGTNAQER